VNATALANVTALANAGLMPPSAPVLQLHPRHDNPLAMPDYFTAPQPTSTQLLGHPPLAPRVFAPDYPQNNANKKLGGRIKRRKTKTTRKLKA
jgi:hypothetical protein